MMMLDFKSNYSTGKHEQTTQGSIYPSMSRENKHDTKGVSWSKYIYRHVWFRVNNEECK